MRNRYKNILIVSFVAIAMPIIIGQLLSIVLPAKWVSIPLHSSIEAIGGTIAIIISMIFFLKYKQKSVMTHFNWSSTALLSMGIFDIFHAFVMPGEIFVWLHSLAVFFGGLFFINVWLEEKKVSPTVYKTIPLVFIVFPILVSLISITQADLIPVMFNEDKSFSSFANILNVVGGVGFFIASLKFIKNYIKTDDPQELLLAGHTMLFGVAGVLFVSSVVWDSQWWLWHIMRLIAYAVAFYFLYDDYRRELYKKELINTQLLEHQSVIDANVITSTTDTQGVITSVSKAFCQVSGYTKDELIGNKHNIMGHSEIPKKIYEEMWATIQAGKIWSGEVKNITKDGETFWNQLIITPQFVNGKIYSYTSVGSDITDKKIIDLKNKEISTSNTQMENVIKGANLGFWDWNYQTGEHHVNERWLEIIGLKRKDLEHIDSDWSEKIHPEDKKKIMPLIEEAIQDKTHYVVEFRMLHSSGNYVWIQGSGAVVEIDDKGDALRLSGTHEDITERQNMYVLRDNLMHDLGERVKELNCIYSIAEIIQSSDELDQILDVSISEIPKGLHYPDFTQVRIILDEGEYSAKGFAVTEWVLSQDIVLNDKVRGRLEVYYTKEFDQLDEGPFLQQERSLIDTIARMISQAIERKEILSQLKHTAAHDALTGVYNRSMLEKKLKKDCQRALRYSRDLCVLMIDIDHFKNVNDSYGHQVGDIVLKETVNCLDKIIRSSDYIGRYGGEEFVVVLTETDMEHALVLAERMRVTIEGKATKTDTGEIVKVTISIGLSKLHEDVKEPKELIKKADEALYLAKGSGRNKVLSS